MDKIYPSYPADREVTEESADTQHTGQQYRPPQLFVIGKAMNLLQGGSGKHTDSYSGYYWNEEG